MLLLVLTACAFGSTCAVYSFGEHSGGFHKTGGWAGGMVVSKRDTEAETVYEAVEAILEQAEEGIVAADLGEAAAAVKAAADAFIDAHGGEVAAEDIEAVIDEVAATFNGAVAVSALFDDPLDFEASLLDSAFCLWRGLVEKAEDLEDAGQSPNPALAAISMTAEAIEGIVLNTVGIITYMNEHDDKRDMSKRWEVSGSVSHSSSGGTSVSVGVSHKWGKRRVAQKRGKWSGGVEAGYSTGGGVSVGAKVSYSWRR